MRNRSAYTWVFFVACIATLTAAAALNVVIDPYSYFRVVRLNGINALKPRPDSNLGSVKLDAALRVGPDGVILGNSRVDVSLDPQNAAWRGLVVYNLGIPGSDICVALSALRALRQDARPNVIVLGVDFPEFLTRSNGMECPRSDDHSDAARIRERLRATGTISAVAESLRTLVIQHDPYADTLTDLGLSPMRSYVRIAQVDGYNAMFRQRAQETAASLLKLSERLHGAGMDPSLEIETLKNVVGEALAHQSRLDILIYPYHVQYLLIFDEIGLWTLFNEWKRLVVATVAKETSTSSNPSVRVWDFSALTEFQVESIPPEGDTATQMRWYWEGGHFNTKLGDKIIERIQDVGSSENCEGFGVLLTPRNVDLCLNLQTESLASYRRTHPNLARDVVQMVTRLEVGEVSRTSPAFSTRNP